jgi:dihydrofolate synthase/folylpolyglutamate synthase
VHWGLDRTIRALEALGDPHRSFRTLHVGGTNGKGSVAATLAAVLRAEGVRAGCYTSPHLCSFRERIQVDGTPLPDATLLERAEEVRDAIGRFGLTFFEAATVLGFQAFARAGVEVAVVEVGLGGRLDATNVVRPEVSAVTNVALDHAEFLGHTLPEIAGEKAGIVKSGVPFITAETDPELLDIFRRITDERGAPLVVLDPERAIEDLEVAADHTAFALRTRQWGRLELRTPLVGRHQAVNAALAVEILEHVPEALRPSAQALARGVAAVRHYGRDQVEAIDGRTWLFDVAHNTAGILTLVDTLDRLDLPRPLVALVGVLGDKDWRAMLPPLFSRTDLAILTQPPSAPPERRWDPAAAAAAVPPVCPIRIQDDFVRALETARDAAGNGTVVVTGSCHTVGGALTVLGREP